MDRLEILSCISNERLLNKTTFQNLVICVYNITKGDSCGLNALEELLQSRKDELLTDSPTISELRFIWDQSGHIGSLSLLPFGEDDLDAWACYDDSSRYEWYSEREEFNLIGESLLFGDQIRALWTGAPRFCANFCDNENYLHRKTMEYGDEHEIKDTYEINVHAKYIYDAPKTPMPTLEQVEMQLSYDTELSRQISAAEILAAFPEQADHDGLYVTTIRDVAIVLY